MSTLGDLLAEHTVLPGSAVDHLHAVVGEWQLLADLSFADYLMWVRRDDGVLVCVAQCRPNTGPTVVHTDAVGTVVAANSMPLVAATFSGGVPGREGAVGQQNSCQHDGHSVEVSPVRFGDQVVAVLTRHQPELAARRRSGHLETAYRLCATDLLRMLAEGTFPDAGDVAMSRSSPRAGDGFIRLDVDGVVSYASPNALSAYHRMGLTTELEGVNLIDATRPLISDPFEAHEVDEHVQDLLAGDGKGMRMEVDAGGATVLLRTLPLVVAGRNVGAAILIRDVTEVKRRDRALISKDATIREIHHRVKNNLQTVAALLRLQARRTSNAEGREALIESVRRVSSIALVHRCHIVHDRQNPVDDLVKVHLLVHRPRHGADHGDHRAGAERDRACVRPGGGGRVRDDSSGTLCALARCRRARRRAWSAARFQPGEVGQPGPADRADLGLCGIGRLVRYAGRPRTWHRCGATGTGRTPGTVDAVARYATVRPRRMSGPHCAELSRQTPVRAFVRALRRFSARRSSSLMPPQTPESWPVFSAQLRHSVVTGHRLQTSFASAICASAGPLFPTGKNSSGSSSRQTALWRQSISRYSSLCAQRYAQAFLLGW